MPKIDNNLISADMMLNGFKEGPIIWLLNEGFCTKYEGWGQILYIKIRVLKKIQKTGSLELCFYCLDYKKKLCGRDTCFKKMSFG